MNYIRETAITIDHDDRICLVDTTVRSVATRLLRRGFKEIGGQGSLPYRRFSGKATQVSFRGVATRGRGNAGSFKIKPKTTAK